jgi:hypothetical protein
MFRADQSSDAPTNGRDLRDREFAMFQALSQFLDQIETLLFCQGLLFHFTKWLFAFGAVIEPTRDESVELRFINEPERVLPDLNKSREVTHLLAQLLAIILIIEKIDKSPCETANTVVVGGFENAAVGLWNIIRNDWFLFGCHIGGWLWAATFRARIDPEWRRDPGMRDARAKPGMILSCASTQDMPTSQSE